MHSRLVFSLAAVASVLAGVLIACGGDQNGGFDDATDSGADGTTNNGGGDSGGDSGKTMQTGMEGGGGGDAGHCTPLVGACDIVLQDCPDKMGQKQECVAGAGADGGVAAVCIAPQPSEQLPLGRGCCPSNNSNPCLPGLECIGDSCIDGGAPTGRCTPHCCPGDDTVCGMSDPEGISGACDVTITINNNDEYFVCTYKDYCTPLGVKPCKEANSACVVQDKTGASTCVPIFNPPAIGEHGNCADPTSTCADGTMCFLKSLPDGGPANFPDGGPEAECLYLCNTPSSATPFDAGLLDGAPGHGGCPKYGDGGGESCKGTLNPADFPAWISLCLP